MKRNSFFIINFEILTELIQLVNSIRFGLKLVEDTEGFLWFWLEKSLFQLENDIFQIFYLPIYLPIKPPPPLLQKRTILEN